MKHLRITYGDTVLFDGTPEKVSWQESASGELVVKAGPDKPASSELLSKLAAAAQQRRNGG